MNGRNQDVGSDSYASTTTTNLTTQAEEEEQDEGLALAPQTNLENRLSLSELGIVNQGMHDAKKEEPDSQLSEDSDQVNGAISSSSSSTSLASSLQTVILSPTYCSKNEKA